MALVIGIGFCLMSCVALAAIHRSFYLMRLMHSQAFRQQVFREVAKENHARHEMLE